MSEGRSDVATGDTKEEKETVEDRGGINRLLKEYGEGISVYGWVGAIGALLNGATMPAFFVLFGDLITIGSDTASIDLRQEALELMIKFLVVGVAFFVFNSMQYVCWGYFGAKLSVSVRKSYFGILLEQDIGYYDAKNSGSLNTSLISHCLNIAGVGTAIGLVLQHFVTFLGGFVLAFYYSWRLSLVLLAVTPLFVGVGIISAKFEQQGVAGGVRGEDDDKHKVSPTAAAGAFSNEVLVNIRSVKSIPALLESKLVEYSEKLLDIVPAAKKKGLGMGIALGGMFFAFLGVMYSVGYWYGGRLVDEGKIDIGDMYLCMFALPIGAMSIGQLGTANADIDKARKAANKMFEIKDRKPEIRKPEKEKKGKKGDRLKGDIEFREVSFSYPSAPEQKVLEKVSFAVESGKTLALCGPSGSGKSTVINLLERYYDPLEGDILVNGEKIHNYDIHYLRKQIGYVSQTPLLFAESIKENIRGGNKNISDADIVRAAKDADAHEFICNLADEYETNVGEMGNRLSGGQKQRICIARAIVNNPSILLLDEATSALDTKSEREVQRAIDKIAESSTQTIVVIAHRLSTIKNADQILVIVDGGIEEEGNHLTLIEKNGVYAALVREQQLTGEHVGIEMNGNGNGNGDREEEKEEEYRTETGLGETDERTALSPKEGDKEEKKEEEEKKEQVPDLGGTKRLSKEYAAQFSGYFYGGLVTACCNGILWPVAYGWFFPEIITILSDEINCEFDADGNIASCHTNFEDAALELAVWWIAIGVYALIVNILQGYFYGLFGVNVGNMVKLDWFRAMIGQDVTYHDNQSSATLNANLSVETLTITDGMGWKYGVLVQSLVQLVAGFVIAFYRSWRVTLIFLALTPLLVISGLIQSMIWMGTGDGDQNADPFLASGAVSQEILINVRTVLAFPDLIGAKKVVFAEKVNEGLPVATKRALVSGLSMGINLMIAQGIVYGVGMYIGLIFADKGYVTFDDVMGSFFGVLMGGMALGQAGSVFSAFKSANLAANKFYNAKTREPERKKPEGKVIQKGIATPSIEFKNVSFAYHSAPETMVLKNVSFKVEGSKSLAIVGPSGSGKSTVVSLIERFYDPLSGDIVLEGLNKIHDYDMSALRSSIGLVSQMPLLFDASIEENIRAGRKEVTKEDIEAAAKRANAHDFIMKLDKQYDTSVGELGGKLSGGQRQRISIARALLGKPSILLLDEATSALDSKSEREVQKAIDNITQSGNITTVSIAHRLSTIKNSDIILVLVDGEIRESGNHKELMALNGVYSALVSAQTLVENTKKRHSKILEEPIQLDEQPPNYEE